MVAGAETLARQAQRSFAARGRKVYAARAVGLRLAAATAAGTLRPSALVAGRRAAATLSAAGWREEGLRVRLAVARAAIELGLIRAARRELAACAPLRRRGPVADRIEAWHVEALIRIAGGNARGAERAARSGLRLLDSYRAALGASDLRATASELGVAAGGHSASGWRWPPTTTTPCWRGRSGSGPARWGWHRCRHPRAAHCATARPICGG